MALNLFKRNKLKEDIEVKFMLEDKHISELKTLLDRNSLLQHLPKSGIVAEIGVDRGEFSKKILNFCKPQKLFLIDAWELERYSSGKIEVQNKFSREIVNNEIEIVCKSSIRAAVDLEDRSLDWVYIDTDHSYNTTLSELYAYSKKIKKNGIIAGHDFCKGNWITQYKYGVIDAVHEFCVKEGYRILYLTSSNEYYKSYAIQKI